MHSQALQKDKKFANEKNVQIKKIVFPTLFLHFHFKAF